MKSLKSILLLWLLSLTANQIIAQQGTVAAGGEASGPGGFMSFSTGQTDYLEYQNQHGALSFGLQQVWPAIHQGILPVLEIPNLSIALNESLCFNATQTVVVAGSEKHFVVESGGHADIIAGHNIIIYPGTWIKSGGSLHARISQQWCANPSGLPSLANSEVIPVHKEPEPVLHADFFKIYPNPTTGIFTLELLKAEEASLLLVEMYTMQGNLVLSREMPASELIELNITEKQPGMYLIRIMSNGNMGVAKIVKK